MAMKRKNRRNSTGGGEGGRKKPAPPQRPPPTPPAAYSGKRTPPPPVAPKKPSLHSPIASPEKISSPSSKPLTLPKPPAIAKKASQVLAEKKRRTVPPKPIPYHIYIKAKEKRLLKGSGGRETGNKENVPTICCTRDTDSDSSTDS